MFCGNCGRKIDENLKFCPNCGRTIEDFNEKVKYEVLEKDSNNFELKETDIINKYNIVLIIFTIALVILSFFSYNRILPIIGLVLGIAGIIISIILYIKTRCKYDVLMIAILLGVVMLDICSLVLFNTLL